MKRSTSSRLAATVAAAALLAPATVLVSAPAAAAAPDDGVLASGDGWSVTTAPGGYLVTYELDEPLPIVSDAPTLLVDGVEIGLAAESDDGESLSVVTSDPTVAEAGAVEKGWASGDAKADESAPAPFTVEDDALEGVQDLALEADIAEPSERGGFGVTEAEYDFGDQAVALEAIGGIRGEMTGKMYLTDAAGARPTVILLHGRHGSCSRIDGLENPLRWPCIDEQVNIRSYQGYEETGRVLASHGYNVVSIAANAVNSNDNQLALDYGAQARGRLILDTLSMLDDASNGEEVSFDDISWPDEDGEVTTVTRTLDEALVYATTRDDEPAADAGVTAASLEGRFDLDQVGIMGHSRGGEGATSAVTLNQGSDDPFGIVSVLPLAPVDFGRMTVPDVPMGVFLPYCDGDVSNQQGQHMFDDSRHAFGDDALRSAVWMMGANHNFFNTIWTPGLYPHSASDDWSVRDETSSCSTQDETRLTAEEQYQLGVTYMTGFFRFTMGGEEQFQPLFDGSVKPTTEATSFADVRVMASQPTEATTLVADFAEPSTLVRTAGDATAQVCASSDTGSSIPATTPYCTTSDIGSGRVPHWSAMRFGGSVPATPVTRVTWTGSEEDPDAPSTGELRVSVPADQRDVSDRAQLSVKVAPDRTVPSGTDFTLTVIDGAGNEFSALASEVAPLAVNRMPGGTHATLNKFVLQQLTIPTAEMTDIDLGDVREVRFSAEVGVDGTSEGGLYLSDLAFETPSAGSAVVGTRTTVNTASTIVEEGDGPSTAGIAVYLDAPSEQEVVGYVNSVGGDGAVAAGMQKVRFAPGETCRVVDFPVNGDSEPSEAGAAGYTVAVTNTANAVMGAGAFSQLVIREDDGVIEPEDDEAIEPVVELPPVGAQGDACDEAAAVLDGPGDLTTSADAVAPGGDVELTATGYRAGEAVMFALDGDEIDTVIADADGTATTTLVIDAAADLGSHEATATGAGSARVQQAEISVLTPTSTTLSVAEGGDLVEGDALTLVAEVAGEVPDGAEAPDGGATGESSAALDGVAAADEPVVEGVVTFVQRSSGAEESELGTAEVVDGAATLALSDGLPAGEHEIVASFARTETAFASDSEPLHLSIAEAPVDETPGGDESGDDGAGDEGPGDGTESGDGGPDDSGPGGAAPGGSESGGSESGDDGSGDDAPGDEASAPGDDGSDGDDTGAGLAPTGGLSLGALALVFAGLTAAGAVLVWRRGVASRHQA